MGKYVKCLIGFLAVVMLTACTISRPIVYYTPDYEPFYYGYYYPWFGHPYYLGHGDLFHYREIPRYGRPFNRPTQPIIHSRHK